jgi:hypothetical protein
MVGFIDRVSTRIFRKRPADYECVHPSCQTGYVQMPVETPEYIQRSNACDHAGNWLKNVESPILRTRRPCADTSTEFVAE